MAFPTSFIDQLRERVTLSDLILSAVGQWDKKKSNPARQDWWAPCPFHHEKSASFHVDNNKGFYHCFGCGAHGDAISWMIDKEKYSYPEAINILAQKAGLSVPEFSPQQQEQQKTEKTLYDALQQAQQFYQKLLYSPSGKEALDYLHKKRFLSDEMIRNFGIGYAPNHGSAITDYLKGNGFSLQVIAESGLTIMPEQYQKADEKPSSKKPYDRFRHRIMFPVCNKQGRIISFGGRALVADAPAKYLNGPESPVFHKSDILYHLNGAVKQNKNMPLIVCEGYMDVIALYKSGFKKTVAPMGTALTESHIDLLWKISPEPILCFDGDQAGLNAAWRSLDKLLSKVKAGYSAHFLFLPQGLDPDDFLTQKGTMAFENLLKNPYSLSHVLFVRETLNTPPQTPERIIGLEQNLKQAIRQIQDKRLQELYWQDISKRLQQLTGYVSKENLKEPVREQRPYTPYRGKNAPIPAPSQGLARMQAHRGSQQQDSLYQIESRFIGLYLWCGHYMNAKDFDILSEFQCTHAVFKRLKQKILQKFYEDYDKGLEKRQKTVNVPVHPLHAQDISNHNKSHFSLYYISDNSPAYDDALQSVACVMKNVTSSFINENQSKYYWNDLRQEFIDMHHKKTILQTELLQAQKIFDVEQSLQSQERFLQLQKLYHDDSLLKNIK